MVDQGRYIVSIGVDTEPQGPDEQCKYGTDDSKETETKQTTALGRLYHDVYGLNDMASECVLRKSLSRISRKPGTSLLSVPQPGQNDVTSYPGQ